MPLATFQQDERLGEIVIDSPPLSLFSADLVADRVPPSTRPPTATRIARLHTCSMASANLDLVRSIYADWERGDYKATGWADPEIEFVIADGPSPSRQRGVIAMTKAWGDVLEVWRDYRAVAEGYRELNDGSVLVATAFSARGRTSNIEVRQVLARGASVLSLRDGKVTKLVLYFNRERALADLGLTPKDG